MCSNRSGVRMQGTPTFEGTAPRRTTGYSRESARRAPVTGPVLFFDTGCSVCRRFVALAVHADRSGQLRIAPLQSARAEIIRHRHPELATRKSALWLPRVGRPQAESDAILSTLAFVGGPWKLLARVGRLVPRSLRDWTYRTFADHRSLFGRLGLAELDETSRNRLILDDRLESHA